jgi:hypothetical protein
LLFQQFFDGIKMHGYSLGTIPLGFRQGVPEKTASVEGACRRTRSFALYRPLLLDNLPIDPRQTLNHSRHFCRLRGAIPAFHSPHHHRNRLQIR